MLVGVISDSHDHIKALQDTIKALLQHRVELVIHLGDIISPFVVKQLKESLRDIPLIAVKGNNDGDVYQLTRLFSSYGWMFYSEPTIVELKNRRLLIMHGYGGVEQTETLARGLLNSLDVNAVLFGHTHRVVIEKRNGKLLLNPGEVCGYLTGEKSYALLDIDTMGAEIHFLEGV